MVGTDQGRNPDGAVPPPPRGRAPLDRLFDGDGLYALRSAVADHAAELGLGEHVVSDLVLIAHELATNAVWSCARSTIRGPLRSILPRSGTRRPNRGPATAAGCGSYGG